MLDLLGQALSWLGDLIGAAFDTLAAFVIGFFPLGDSAVFAVIDSWDVSGGALTLNVLYFLDLPMVMLCAGVAVTVVGVCVLVSLVRWIISVIHDVMDSIPVVG